MIDISGHLRPYRNELGFEDNTTDFVINCCGYQHFLTKDFSRLRPNGRLDFQLIYISIGCGYFKLNHQWIKREKGDIQIFLPGERQEYTYYAKDTPEVFWIHFTGKNCKKLLEEYDIHSCHIGENILFKTLFQEIILELQLKKYGFEAYIASNFIKLLISFNRTLLNEKYSAHTNFALDRLILELNQHYQDFWSIEKMAEYCNLSQDYLSHLFKKEYHITPMKYLSQIRINKAKDFLAYENLPISEVSYLVGYSDPLYFSRTFKKSEQVSPQQYRRDILQIHTPFHTYEV